LCAVHFGIPQAPTYSHLVHKQNAKKIGLLCQKVKPLIRIAAEKRPMTPSMNPRILPQTTRSSSCYKLSKVLQGTKRFGVLRIQVKRKVNEYSVKMMGE